MFEKMIMPFAVTSLAQRMGLLTAITILPVCVLAATVTKTPAPTGPLECLVIKHASIKGNPVKDPVYGLANIGHQIVPGARNVLSVRAWNDGDSWDTAQLWKITLEIAPIPNSLVEGKVAHIQVLRSYFTYGGLAWLSDGLYYRGENTIHQIELRKTKTGFALMIAGPIDATDGIGREHLRTVGTWQCDVVQRSLVQLNLWEGKIGTTLNSFHPAKTLRPIETF
jgi:hypothetical protein